MTRFAAIVLAALLAGCGGGPGFHGPDVPYVVTPDDVAVQMLTLAAVTARDEVWDLGSGDGRVVITAARQFGARGVGVEIDATLVQDSVESAARAGVADRTTFLWRDLFQVDLRPATVVTLYLLPELNLRLRPKLLAELAPGSRVVSHQFDMAEWEADASIVLRAPAREHRVRLWIIPARIDGDWTFDVQDGDRSRTYRASLQQRFQRFGGTLTAGDQTVTVDDGRLRGDAVTFTVGGARWAGTVNGEAATGTIERAGSTPRRAWAAHRTR